MHTPYQQLRGHIHDFEVKYRFYTYEEGGRSVGPSMQGYRPDFWYEHEAHTENQMFMIYPEFLNANGEVILDKTTTVPMGGKAYMWVATPSYRNYHLPKLHVGMKCYMMEGSQRVGEYEITKIVGLATNPRTR